MRTTLAAIAVMVLAGCAGAPSGEATAVYDRKYNQTTYVAKQTASEFVGTGATKAKAAKATPSWYRYGHP